MRGSVAKKGKRWYAVVYDGVDPVTGKYRRRWVPAGTRRADAEKVLADLVKRSHEGNTVVSEKVTLGTYLTGRWLPVQQPRLRRSTYDSYRRWIGQDRARGEKRRAVGRTGWCRPLPCLCKPFEYVFGDVAASRTVCRGSRRADRVALCVRFAPHPASTTWTIEAPGAVVP